MEDKESCTTEIFFNNDNTVQVGESDGPLCKAASGTYETSPDGRFKMVLKRTFEAGRDQQDATDVGYFEFEVERTLLGEFAKVGNEDGISGTMHHYDDIGIDQEVGYFTMIETTTERLKQAS